MKKYKVEIYLKRKVDYQLVFKPSTKEPTRKEDMVFEFAVIHALNSFMKEIQADTSIKAVRIINRANKEITIREDTTI